VARHRHDPSYNKNNDNNNSNSSNNSSSSSRSDSGSLTKISSQLPRWTKTSICRPFLQRIQQILLGAKVPKQDWIRAFLFVIEDVTACNWITKNIVEPQLS